MRRFLVIISLITFTTSLTFADCSPGTYEGTLILPTTSGTASGSYSAYTITFSDGETLTLQGTCSKIQGSAASGYMSESRPTRSSSSDSNVNCWCKIQSYGGYNLTAKWIFVDGGLTYCSVVCGQSCAAAYGNPDEWLWQGSWDNPSIDTQESFRNLYQSSLINPPTVCKSCSDKPANTEWTTGCEYQCGAGTYTVTTTSSATTTEPITWPTTDGTSSTYDGSSRTWSVTWSDDTASGSAACSTSSTGSPKASVMNSTSSSAKYCWCKVTDWNSNSLDSKWIYISNRSSGSTCRGTGTSGCAYSCSNYMKTNSPYRSQMFATVTNVPTTEVTTTTTTTTCESCPSGGTSNAGATEITQCYIPTTTNFTDSIGTYHYSSNCYYSN